MAVCALAGAVLELPEFEALAFDNGAEQCGELVSQHDASLPRPNGLRFRPDYRPQKQKMGPRPISKNPEKPVPGPFLPPCYAPWDATRRVLSAADTKACKRLFQGKSCPASGLTPLVMHISTATSGTSHPRKQPEVPIPGGPG